jgi:hypothetical protein
MNALMFEINQKTIVRNFENPLAPAIPRGLALCGNVHANRQNG